MARVIPGDFNPTNLKRRRIYSSRFHNTPYYYRRKATPDDKRKTRRITEFTPQNEKVRMINRIWANLPPCKREALRYQIDPQFGVSAYDLFSAMCRSKSADDLAQFINDIDRVWRCWCIHPRDQAKNPYHTSSCLHLRINNLPSIKPPYSALILNKDYIYNKCKAHVNYAESPDGWSSHWGGVRLDPDRHMDKSFNPDKGQAPHYWLDEFRLKTDLGVGIYKPQNVNFSIAFDGYPEYNVNWIPIEFQRNGYPYDHYPPWDRDHILYYGCGMAGPNPDGYNCIGARFTPPEYRVTMCKSNMIEVRVSYNSKEAVWRARGGTDGPHFNIILWGQTVATLGVGGGKTATAEGVIPNPRTLQSVPISKETLDHEPGLADWIHYYADIQEGELQSKKVIYWGDPSNGWINEIQYVFKFNPPLLLKGNSGYPSMRIDATTPTEYYRQSPGSWSNGYYPAKCSFYPGSDPWGWYYYRDPYGPLLQKGVTSYCFQYSGYYNGYIDKIFIRYSASATPLYPEPFKGGGIKSLKVLRIMPNEDKDPYDKAFYQNLKEKYGIKPPQL